jgi:hypothetical protein
VGNAATYYEVYAPSSSGRHKDQLAEETRRIAEYCRERVPLPSQVAGSEPAETGAAPAERTGLGEGPIAYVFAASGELIAQDRATNSGRRLIASAEGRTCRPPGQSPVGSSRVHIQLGVVLQPKERQEIMEAERVESANRVGEDAWRNDPPDGNWISNATLNLHDPTRLSDWTHTSVASRATSETSDSRSSRVVPRSDPTWPDWSGQRSWMPWRQGRPVTSSPEILLARHVGLAGSVLAGATRDPRQVPGRECTRHPTRVGPEPINYRAYSWARKPPRKLAWFKSRVFGVTVRTIPLP